MFKKLKRLVMTFYKSIAKYYDQIFPLNSKQLDFVYNDFLEKDKKELSILDIGCATGNLALDMASAGSSVIAIDLDEKMINIAKDKLRKGAKNPSLRVLDMLKITNNFKPKSFDQILCFGNTLVHLDTLNEIEDFLKQVYSLLKSGGEYKMQIINYDRILDQQIEALPTIENEQIIFHRVYRYLPGKHKINFKTKLEIKEKKEYIENSLLLLPMRKNELEKLLHKIGFKDVEFYASFAKAQFNENSMPLVVSARK